ncbi:hypothetical protein BP6252_02146 [Coleophoma cylindrospora]|uniref:Uncharacterized protein n=1 Tax=Coleophoma cylindrospora TaxID=1849047 RepID=A0A3D8SDZ2_9HELO|nr:hypothetical protein BP6252_02146 [Coleophoma cylindrospora]
MGPALRPMTEANDRADEIMFNSEDLQQRAHGGTWATVPYGGWLVSFTPWVVLIRLDWTGARRSMARVGKTLGNGERGRAWRNEEAGEGEGESRAEQSSAAQHRGKDSSDLRTAGAGHRSLDFGASTANGSLSPDFETAARSCGRAWWRDGGRKHRTKRAFLRSRPMLPIPGRRKSCVRYCGREISNTRNL